MSDQRKGGPSSPKGVDAAGAERIRAATEPTVYAWAVWRDPDTTHGFRRVRMHLPMSLVLAHAVEDPRPADLLSRVVPNIELELVDERLLRGERWTR